MSTNAAFVFIKPHANTAKAQELVEKTLKAKGITIVSQGEILGEQIDEGKLIDQHYYAIASKATLVKPKDLPVPKDKFEKEFGLNWDSALEQGIVFNALDAAQFLGFNASQLDEVWNASKKVKFGGGFYCGRLEAPGKPVIYTFNAFFMTMRSKFVTPGTSIHYYSVEFSPNDLSWQNFRVQVLGPTDPAAAPADSLRGIFYSKWAELDLTYQPNVGDNGVHASASPFEGLAERINWLKATIASDSFGARLLAAGLSETLIRAWSVDPQVGGRSIFDQLEDTDVDECFNRMAQLASTESNGGVADIAKLSVEAK